MHRGHGPHVQKGAGLQRGTATAKVTQPEVAQPLCPEPETRRLGVGRARPREGEALPGAAQPHCAGAGSPAFPVLPTVWGVGSPGISCLLWQDPGEACREAQGLPTAQPPQERPGCRERQGQEPHFLGPRPAIPLLILVSLFLFPPDLGLHLLSGPILGGHTPSARPTGGFRPRSRWPLPHSEPQSPPLSVGSPWSQLRSCQLGAETTASGRGHQGQR